MQRKLSYNLAERSPLHALDRKPRPRSQSYIGPTTGGPDIQISDGRYLRIQIMYRGSVC